MGLNRPNLNIHEEVSNQVLNQLSDKYNYFELVIFVCLLQQ